MEFHEQVKNVKSREDLAEFVRVLERDLKDNPADWENRSLGEFLGSLSAWIADMDGYYLNNNLDVPKDPSWRTIAEILVGARIYE
jgi:hypothetical protein